MFLAFICMCSYFLFMNSIYHISIFYLFFLKMAGWYIPLLRAWVVICVIFVLLYSVFALIPNQFNFKSGPHEIAFNLWHWNVVICMQSCYSISTKKDISSCLHFWLPLIRKLGYYSRICMIYTAARTFELPSLLCLKSIEYKVCFSMFAFVCSHFLPCYRFLVISWNKPSVSILHIILPPSGFLKDTQQLVLVSELVILFVMPMS